MHLSGSAALLRLTGELSDPVLRQLDELLNWLIATGSEQVTLELDTTDQIDPALSADPAQGAEPAEVTTGPS